MNIFTATRTVFWQQVWQRTDPHKTWVFGYGGLAATDFGNKKHKDGEVGRAIPSERLEEGGKVKFLGGFGGV